MLVMLRNLMAKKITKFLLALFMLSVGFFFYLDLHLYLRPVPKDFEQLIKQQMESAKFPSMSVLVFKEEKVVFAKSFGYANIENKTPATPESLYQIASVSKLVTATAVMQLFEQGRLALDDDINRYLPFAVRNPRHPNMPITFRMLLTHSSGINDGSAYFDSYTLGLSEDPLESLEFYIKNYLEPEGKYYDVEDNFIDAKPGTQLNYSNIGFGLLGLLVEQLSGVPFDEYCRINIFEPLGMTKTVWFNKDLDKSLAAMPYGYNVFNKSFYPLGYFSFSNYPDGALKTSTSEFMRFLYLFTNKGITLDGQRFLKSETVENMLRPQIPSVSDIPGLGWANMSFGNMHGGSDPGVATYVLISKEEKWGVIMFANSGGLPAWRTELGLEIRDELYDYIKNNGVPF